MAGAAQAQDAKTAEALSHKALLDRTAWDITEDLTTNIGPRVVGSPNMEKAKDWAVAKFKALGFTNVKVEEFAKPSWTRGPESVELVAPYAMKLGAVGLGRTVSTPAGGIEADVVVFKTYAEMIAAPEEFAEGQDRGDHPADGPRPGRRRLRRGGHLAPRRPGRGRQARGRGPADPLDLDLGLDRAAHRRHRLRRPGRGPFPPPPSACRKPSSLSAWRP